jgi:hypothetical protein
MGCKEDGKERERREGRQMEKWMRKMEKRTK